MSETFVLRGRSETPEPLRGKALVRLATCPSCKGRGWFLINPFATGGWNGLGGSRNLTQCLTCLDAHDYFVKHEKLPDGIPYPEEQ